MTTGTIAKMSAFTSTAVPVADAGLKLLAATFSRRLRDSFLRRRSARLKDLDDRLLGDISAFRRRLGGGPGEADLSRHNALAKMALTVLVVVSSLAVAMLADRSGRAEPLALVRCALLHPAVMGGNRSPEPSLRSQLCRHLR